MFPCQVSRVIGELVFRFTCHSKHVNHSSQILISSVQGSKKIISSDHTSQENFLIGPSHIMVTHGNVSYSPKYTSKYVKVKTSVNWHHLR